MLGVRSPREAAGSATTIPALASVRRYPAAMRRGCARPACGKPATVTLSYGYESATVWLEPLTPEGHPMTHDLCDRHAARTVPPRGWELVDLRTVTTSLAS